MAGTDRRGRARTAMQTVAARYDLPSDLHILSERWNTVARLGDSGVIAKAATLAHLARSDPAHWFQLEVDVCAELFTRGVAVQRPYSPDAIVVDDLPVTLWHEVEGVMGDCTEDELVQSLAHMHECGADLLRDRPWFATITSHFEDVFPLLQHRQTVTNQSLGVLKLHFERLMDRISTANTPNCFIHGDAQRKNAMRTAAGPVWIDFEESSYGPVAWDLACLTMHRRFDADRVLDRYAEVSGYPRIPTAEIDVFKQLRDLEAVTWMLAIQEEREPEFGAEASGLLSEVLTAATAD